MSGIRRRIVRELIADVAASRLHPGDPLPSEEGLAVRYGVTAEVARYAVDDLATLGIAQVHAGGPAVVGPEAGWNVLDPMVLEVLLASPHGPAILAEYLEYRRVVEVIAAEMAAQHATTADLATLSDALARMTEASDEARFHRADVDFHHALIAAGRNRTLERAADPLRPALCTARPRLARPELRERARGEHRRILTAVARADADAARAAMTAHLDTVESYLREYAGRAGCGSETSGRPDDR